MFIFLTKSMVSPPPQPLENAVVLNENYRNNHPQQPQAQPSSIYYPNYSTMDFLMEIILGGFAAYLSLSCRYNMCLGTPLRIFFAVLCFFFWPFYLLMYYPFYLVNKCVYMCPSSPPSAVGKGGKGKKKSTTF